LIIKGGSLFLGCSDQGNEKGWDRRGSFRGSEEGKGGLKRLGGKSRGGQFQGLEVLFGEDGTLKKGIRLSGRVKHKLEPGKFAVIEGGRGEVTEYVLGKGDVGKNETLRKGMRIAPVIKGDEGGKKGGFGKESPPGKRKRASDLESSFLSLCSCGKKHQREVGLKEKN